MLGQRDLPAQERLDLVQLASRLGLELSRRRDRVVAAVLVHLSMDRVERPGADLAAFGLSSEHPGYGAGHAGLDSQAVRSRP